MPPAMDSIALQAQHVLADVATTCTGSLQVNSQIAVLSNGARVRTMV